MGTIAEKLSYLTDTKDLFKDRLNSLGAEITSSTTFRNYLTWLDEFYGEVSDKTDLSENGVVGRTSQETTTGANVMPVVNVTKTVNGITLTNNGNGTITLNGTATAQIVYPITNTGNNTLRRVLVTENDYKFMLYGDTNVSNDTYFLQVLFGLDTETTKSFAAIDNGATSLHIETDRSIGYALIIRNGQSFNNHIIKPMGVLSTYTGGFEPYTNGASPNPDYPQPINNLSGDVLYKISGKNKLNTSTIEIGTKNGVTCSYNNETQEITFNGTCTTNNTRFSILNNSIPFTINTTTICAYLTNEGNNTGNGLFRVFADNYDTYDYLNLTTLTSTNRMISKKTSATITKTIFDFRFDNGAVLDNFKIKLMITDSEDTTYEPYIEPQTFNIPLGDIELCEIDTNKDKIYSSNGRFYLYKENGKSILNGSENWIFNSSPSTPTPRSIAYIYNSLSDYQQSYYSSHFKYGHTATSNRLVLGTSSSSQRWNMSLDNNITGIISTDTNAEKLNKIKNWLSNDNVSVYYVLLEATTTEITASNYPELYAALKEIQDYLTSYKINKEFILGYSSPEIEY